MKNRKPNGIDKRYKQLNIVKNNHISLINIATIKIVVIIKNKALERLIVTFMFFGDIVGILDTMSILIIITHIQMTNG